MQTPKKNPKTYLKQSTLILALITHTLLKKINNRLKAFNPQSLQTLETDLSFQFFEEDFHFEKLIKIVGIKNLKVRADNQKKLRNEFHVKILLVKISIIVP